MSNLIRVTEVLSLFQTYWKIPEEILARKCELGTKIHQDICDHFFGDPPDPTPYFQSFKEWAEWKGDICINYFEDRIEDEELGLSGCPDMVCEENGKLVLYDFKTAAKDDPICWPLQGTAYIELLRRKGNDVSDTFHFLKLRKDGKRCNVFTYKYTTEQWGIFCHAMECAKYFQKKKGVFPAF